MTHIQGEIVINRPLDEVFDFVVDERNEPRYNPNMLRAEKTSDGPVGLGTRFSAETRTYGRPAALTLAITGYERPRRYALMTHLDRMDIQGDVTFAPVPGGTRMRWSWDVQPRGVYRLMGPLVAWLGRRQEETIWAGLKRYLEGQAMVAPRA